jgi:hypothetical protein
MADYIGKKMMVDEAMSLFPKDMILMRHDDESAEERVGEILWIGTDGFELNKKLASTENLGRHGIIHGAWHYENSLGGICRRNVRNLSSSCKNRLEQRI